MIGGVDLSSLSNWTWWVSFALNGLQVYVMLVVHEIQAEARKKGDHPIAWAPDRLILGRMLTVLLAPIPLLAIGFDVFVLIRFGWISLFTCLLLNAWAYLFVRPIARLHASVALGRLEERREEFESEYIWNEITS